MTKTVRPEIVSREDGEFSRQPEEKGFQMRRQQVQRLGSMRDLGSVHNSCVSLCPDSRCSGMAFWTDRS